MRRAYGSPLFVPMFLFCLAGLANATVTIYALTDAPLYAPNATLTVNGKAFEGTSGVASTAVSMRVWNSTAGTINTSSSSPTSSDGSFSANITAPSSEANYNVTVTIGTGNATLPFQVSAKTRVEIYIVNSTNMGFTVNLGSCNSSNYNSSEISGAVKCGNFSFSSATYYVLAQKSGSVFDRLFLDDDEVLNFTATEAGVPLQKLLSEGNSVAVGTLSLTILFIDPFGGMAVLGNLITPSFTGTAGENASLLAIPINWSGGPVTSGSLNLDFVDGNGTTLNSSTPGIPANGVFNATFNISTTGGTDYIRSDKSQVTYAVNKFYLRPAVRTSDGNDIASAAPGTALLMIASVVTSTTQTPITSGVTAWATIRWPNASVSNITLGFFSGTSAYNSTFTAPSIAGEYLAEFTAAYNGSTQAVTVPFEVSPYEVVVKPMAKGKDGASD